jgi:transcriptional regulator of arginine metabolism
MPKTHRQRLIARLLGPGTVKSQEQLRALLHENGVAATQGTLSRDLAELGVVKTPTGYSLPKGFGPSNRPATTLEAVLSAHVLSAEPAGTMVVVKTEPGHASGVAAEIDRNSLGGVVGSLAGDDTVFLAIRSPGQARTVSIHLQKLAGILG